MKVLDKRGIQRQKKRRESPTDRQERIEGWKQDRIEQGRVLVLGAGALGNEVTKNLALMGLGYMFIADMDYVSHGNLSRAVFFRESDARHQRYKAEIVAQRAKAINVTRNAAVQAFHGDIVWQLGGGIFRRVDAVLGCLDNVEARMKANETCLFTHTPYLDGGILGLAGNLTAVHPPTTPCWACTTSAMERANARNRYDSCSNVMRRDIEAGRLPAVQIASSIIAGFQTQETVKIIQGQTWAAGCVIQYDASTSWPYLDVLTISRRPGCWCNHVDAIDEVLELPVSATENTMQDLVSLLIQHGYPDPCIALPGQFVVTRSCIKCQRQELLMRPIFRLDTTILRCSFCGADGNEAIKLLSISNTDIAEFEEIENGREMRGQMMHLTLAEIGFPALALVRFYANSDTPAFGLVAELSADAVDVMGGDQFVSVRSRT